MIIEVDGGQHGLDRYLKRDATRDRDLQMAGYRILRFWNNEVDRQIDGVVKTILTALSERSPHPARPVQGRDEPPFPHGEG